jgi:hypothetical protein
MNCKLTKMQQEYPDMAHTAFRWNAMWGDASLGYRHIVPNGTEGAYFIVHYSLFPVLLFIILTRHNFLLSNWNNSFKIIFFLTRRSAGTQSAAMRY